MAWDSERTGSGTTMRRVLQMISVLVAVQNIAGASCPTAQSEACLAAGKAGNVDDISGGGTCREKSYGSEFTHVCRVHNYSPQVSLSHCCCVVDDEALCCTYHQNWDLFRCSRVADAVGSTSSSISLYILIPAILGSLFLLVLFLVCLKKACTTDDGLSASPGCGLCMYSNGGKHQPTGDVAPDESSDQLSPLPHQPRRMASRVTNNAPLTERKHSASSSSSSQPLLPPFVTDDSHPTLPSAPSEDDVTVAFSLGPHFCRTHSQGVLPKGPPDVHPDFERSVSVPVSTHHRPSICPSCSSATPVPPPSYDESHDHQAVP